MAVRFWAKKKVEQPNEADSNLVKDEKPERASSPLLVYFQLLAYAAATWKDVALMVVGAVCAAASGVPFPLMAILFGQLVDDINGAACEVDSEGDSGAYESSINDKVLQLTYISIGALVLIFVHLVSWNIFSQRLAHRLREDYFFSLLRQDQAFIDEHQAGEVSSRLNRDIQTVQSGTCEKVGMVIASLSFFITAYVVAFTREARLAGMLISLVPAFLLVALLGGAFFQKYSVFMTNAATAASNIAAETLSHITVVKAFGAGARLEAKYAQVMQVSRTFGIKKGAVAALQAGFLYFIAYSANALAFWQGSRMIVDLIEGIITGRGGGSTVGQIYTVVFILVDACVILGTTAPFLPLFGSAAAAYETLKREIAHKATVDGTSEGGSILPHDTPGAVEIRNISFAYPSRPEQKILHGVDLKFPAGQYTAIVGPSGSGKSTIAALLTRLYDPSQGEILIDGLKLADLNVKCVRGLASLVQQEPTLLSRSIFENISSGLINSQVAAHQRLKPLLKGGKLTKFVSQGVSDPNVIDECASMMPEVEGLVHRAAELADAHTFIRKLPQGYATVVGTIGQSLSGGQRQRVAIARALIRDPRILILDEATASLDSMSEQRVQEAIERLAGSRTIISIAHRLSTIKNADNIIVLHEGKVVDQGTYEELLSRPGIFSDMVKSQTLASADHDDPEREGSRDSMQGDSINTSTEKLASFKEDEKKWAKSSDDKSPPESNEALQPGQATSPTTTAASVMDSTLSPWMVIRSLGRYTRPQLWWLLMAMSAAVIVGLTFIAAGLIFGHAVGSLTPCTATIRRILYLGEFFGGMLFMVAGVELFANFISWSSFAVVSERLLYTLRVFSFRSLLEKSIQWHQTKVTDASELLSVITKDCAAIAGFSGSTVGTLFSIMVNFLVAIVMCHIIAWKIAVVCLTMVPILLGTGIMQLRTHSKFEERNSKAFTKAVGISTEAVTLFSTIATFSLEQDVSENFRQALSAPRKEIVIAGIYTNGWLAISNSTAFFVYAFAYWWGSHQVIRGENTQKQFFIILVAMLISAQLWGQAFTLAPEISRARASASRILSLIFSETDKDESIGGDESSEVDSASRDIEKSAAVGGTEPSRSTQGAAIQFRTVSFSYPSSPDTTVLEDVAFEIQPGHFCGLVGPSGAGKSTIINLLQNMYRPTSGSVEIDGVSVSHRDFRNDIAIVPQENALFSGSIKFNVGLGTKPGQDATDEEIEEACRLANLHDTISALPEGYDTECGPNGTHLSGGQRQRLAIARALVRRPRLLILDESTSALDAQTELALQEGLESVIRKSGITVLAITHRLHTVLKANVILVVEGGRLVASGTHEQLLRTSETYRVNAEQQMLK
ncbi:hypothetical protein AYO21_10700 [Fonsecaea monophora]|uniref:Leptomycin B resistance protein pmd1 n=1 Tax=Fonsecaea monophora TaxID=254056 RepID=A0A177ESY9_9EURO|nr:hypothetical protein AYO21_10700 [Fonsecaea monophora]KAH0835275.1 ABC transporter B family member 21 [Fonsecaea pedrosoi]OAG35133.1 hypothetical protein AYO21_10700 [Fonsecaea monophora]